MKKLFLLLFVIISLYTYAEPIIIGVAEPYIFSQNTESLFVQNNLLFELFSSHRNEDYVFLSIENQTNVHNNYFSQNIEYAINNNFDALLLIEVFSHNPTVYIHVKYVSPTNNVILFSEGYTLEFNIQANDNLEEVVKEILAKIIQQELPQTIKQKNISEKSKQKDNQDPSFSPLNMLMLSLNFYPKHELFFSHGFLKNNSFFLTLSSLYVGYSFYLSEVVFVDIGNVAGFGFQQKDFNFNMNREFDYYFGFFAGGHVFVKGILEPNFGIRGEILYTSKQNFMVTIPLEIGLKLFINRRNIFRITSSFPITTYNITKNKWSKELTIGFTVGYGFKLK